MLHHVEHLQHLNDCRTPPGTVTPWQLEDVQVLLEDPNLSPVPKSICKPPIDLLISYCGLVRFLEKYLLLIRTMEGLVYSA